MLPIVHQSLAKSELLPSEHLVDMGYYRVPCMLVDSQQRHGVVIVGPVVEDTSWQGARRRRVQQSEILFTSTGISKS